MMEEALPADVRHKVRQLSGGRSPDGSEAVVNAEVEALLEAEVSSGGDSVLTAVAEAAGQNLAVSGSAETLGALSAGRVDTLVVCDDPSGERIAWFSSDPALVAADRADLEVPGENQPREGRLVDVAVRGAFGTAASVYVIEDPDKLRDGIAGLLRWSEPG
jgi:peptide subunit release factor 1 (eRF1)